MATRLGSRAILRLLRPSLARFDPSPAVGRTSDREARILTTRCPYALSRPNSTAANPRASLGTAEEIAKDMLDNNRTTTFKRSQILDANQLQKLCITLNRPHLSPDQDMTQAPPEHGTIIPPGYHLVYFTPSDLESDLGADGTDQPFAPGSPFTRRMWAGGRVRWYPDNPLRVGDRVTESTKLLRVVPKTSKHGVYNAMLIATVEKTFSNDNGLAVKEDRTWVFLEPPAKPSLVSKPSRLTHQDPHMNSSVSNYEPESDSPFPSRRLQWSAKALFRFSALTLNAHMIHLNPDWCRNIEGLPGLVVHGPLNLINMMDYWRDIHGQDGKLQPLEVSYRATTPLFVQEPSLMNTVSVEDIKDGVRAGQSSYKIRLSKAKDESKDPLGGENLTIVMEGEIRAGPI